MYNQTTFAVTEKGVDKMADMVNHPAHYTDGKIEVIEYIEDKKLGYCLGNAIKYISRAGKKDKAKEIEDLKKAAWYIARRIKELEECAVSSR
jgi:ribosomal protein S6